jgi:hypothetical protein
MLHTKLINDLDEMRTLAFPPPFTLMDSIEDAAIHGRKWRVIMAHERNSENARWVAVLPDSEESQFFSDGDQLNGRWDSEHEIFIPKEGSPLNLLGKPVSLSSIEEDEEEEEEDAEEEERKWKIASHRARENGSHSWGQGECRAETGPRHQEFGQMIPL